MHDDDHDDHAQNGAHGDATDATAEPAAAESNTLDDEAVQWAAERAAMATGGAPYADADLPPMEETIWSDIDGVPCVTFSTLQGRVTLPLAELTSDPLAAKLARILHLLPPSAAPGQALPITQAMADNDPDPLFDDNQVQRIWPPPTTPAPTPRLPPAASEGTPPPEAPLAEEARPPISHLARPTPPSGERMRVGGVLWPAGPLGISAERVGTIAITARESLAFQQHPNDPGLSRSRLQHLLHGVPNNRLLAGMLMVWFDAAGVLAPPKYANRPFRTSRLFRDGIELAEIAAQLDATALPDIADVEAAFTEE